MDTIAIPSEVIAMLVLLYREIAISNKVPKLAAVLRVRTNDLEWPTKHADKGPAP